MKDMESLRVNYSDDGVKDEEAETQYLGDDTLPTLKPTNHCQHGYQGLVAGLDDKEFGSPYGWLTELGTDIEDLIAKSTRTVQQDCGGKIVKFVYIDPGYEDIYGPCQARSCAAYMHLAEKEQAEAEGRDKMRMVFIFQHKEFWPAADGECGKEDEQLKGTTDQRQAFIKSNDSGLRFAQKIIEVYLWPGEVNYPSGETVNGYHYFDCIEFYLYLDPSNAWSDFIYKNMEENQFEDLLFKKLQVGRLGHRDRDKIIKRCWLLRDKIYEDLDAFTGGCFKSKMARQDDRCGDDFDKDLQQKVDDDFSDSEDEDEEGRTQYLRDDSLVNFKPTIHSEAGAEDNVKYFDDEDETLYDIFESLETSKPAIHSGDGGQDDHGGDDVHSNLEQDVHELLAGYVFGEDFTHGEITSRLTTIKRKNVSLVESGSCMHDDPADIERASGITVKKRRLK